ncbi:hypothetical protein, partial [Actinoplanes campanulatus]
IAESSPRFRCLHQTRGGTTDAIALGYRSLMRKHPDIAVAVPDAPIEQVHAFIADELIKRKLAVRR